MYLDWLASSKRPLFEDCLKIRLNAIREGGYESVAIAEEDPIIFLASLYAAHEARVPCFLCNPGWKQDEWSQCFAQLTPDVLWGQQEIPFSSGSLCFKRDMKPYHHLVMIPTGGAGGRVRFVMHRLESLELAAKALRRHWGLESLNAVSVLPLAHVSGLMPVIRAVATGGECVFSSPSELLACPPELNLEKPWLLSLVPTLLSRFLENPDLCAWMQRFYAVIVGGAALDENLFKRSRDLGIPVVKTYGATETGAMVAIQDPENPRDGVGQVLPHALIECEGALNAVGEIRVISPSLFWGYYPEKPYPHEYWESGDYGSVDDYDCLTVLGRKDGIINTGGEKVAPWEVERLIIETGLVEKAHVLGVDDTTWGQRVVAAYVPKNNALDASVLEERLKGKCASWMVPKQWLSVGEIPTNDRGKVDKQELLQKFLSATS